MLARRTIGVDGQSKDRAATPDYDPQIDDSIYKALVAAISSSVWGPNNSMRLNRPDVTGITDRSLTFKTVGRKAGTGPTPLKLEQDLRSTLGNGVQVATVPNSQNLAITVSRGIPLSMRQERASSVRPREHTPSLRERSTTPIPAGQPLRRNYVQYVAVGFLVVGVLIIWFLAWRADQQGVSISK